jgi:type IV pilus assembly protein PilN
MHHVDINLIQTKTKRKEWLFITIFLVSLLLILSFWLLSEYQDKQLQVTELNQSIASQVSVPVVVEGESTQNELERYVSFVEWAESQPYSKVVLLVELSKKLPERGYFTSFLYKDDSVELEVQFDNHAEAAFYLTSIHQSSFVEKASLLSLTNDTLAQETAVNEETFVQPRTIATYTLTLNNEALKNASSEQEDAP